MRKEISRMSERELLMELVQEKRKLERLRHIREAVVVLVILALVILGCVYVPRVVAPIRQFQQTMDELQHSLDRFNASMGEFDALSAQAKDFFDRAGAMGLERLQQAVDQLSEAANRVSGFFTRGG